MALDHRNTVLLQLSVWVLVCVSMVSPCFADGITRLDLRGTVRVSEDRSLTVGDLAKIDGDQADRISGLNADSIVRDGEGAWSTVDPGDLRELLDAEPSVNVGSLTISGGEIKVRRISSKPMTASKPVVATKKAKEQIRTTTEVRDHIARWVVDRYEIGKDAYRIEYRDLDQAFLSTPTEGRLVEIREVSRRGRTAMRVFVYDKHEIVDEKALIFDVLVERELLVMRERLNRRETIESSNVSIETRWVSPEEMPAPVDSSIGMALTRAKNPGQTVLKADLEQPTVIKRGDLISAKSISGSVVVTVKGRARANAKLGEVIEFESLDGENKYRAKAVGNGRAVIVKPEQFTGASS